jgi:hypothetical protein
MAGDPADRAMFLHLGDAQHATVAPPVPRWQVLQVVRAAGRHRHSRNGRPGTPGGRAAEANPYWDAEDRNATSAWIWVGLRDFENVFGMIPAL